jgi:hypothetical protein
MQGANKKINKKSHRFFRKKKAFLKKPFLKAPF